MNKYRNPVILLVGICVESGQIEHVMCARPMPC